MEMASNPKNVEHIMSLDDDDTELAKYVENFKNAPGSGGIIGSNKNVVEATNKALEHARGEILIYLSDDFKCPKDWDRLIMHEFRNMTSPALIKVDDCLQRFFRPVVTMPIMNSQLINKLGYFFNPEYASMYVDEDLYWVCKNNNWIYYAPELKFPHEHHSIGKCEIDETYRRSEANYASGKEIFEKRKKENFSL